MISPVSVDLVLFLNARAAAFLSRAEPAIHPSIVGFRANSPLATCWRAQHRNTATLTMKICVKTAKREGSSNSAFRHSVTFFYFGYKGKQDWT